MQKLKLKTGVIYNFKGIELAAAFLNVSQINRNGDKFKIFVEVKATENSTEIIENFNYNLSLSEVQEIETSTGTGFVNSKMNLTDATVNFLLTQQNPINTDEILSDRWEIIN
jgi:hypothetical protein